MESADLDGVRPPPGQSPTLVVWWRYASRWDQLKYSACWAAPAVICAFLAVVVPGLNGDVDGFVVVMVGLVLLWLFGHFFAANVRTFHAAGRNWLMTNLSPTSHYTWVRTDELTVLRVVNRRAGPYLVLVDRDGRNTSIQGSWLRSSEPLRQVLLAAIQTSGPADIPLEVKGMLGPPVVKPSGRTVVRVGPPPQLPGQPGWGPPAVRPS